MNFISGIMATGNRRRLIWCFLVWWLVMIIAYLVVTTLVGKIEKEITESGVLMAQKFSDQVNLPLLEQNIQVMSELLTGITSHPDVVYAAIINHQNCIIAYTNSELIIPVDKKSTKKTDQVSFWEGNFSKKYLFNFITDVVYSGTKIGEIDIALSAAMINKVKDIYILIAVSSFFCLLLVIAVLYYNGFGYLSRLLKTHERPKASEPIALSEGSYISCPLCGINNSLTKNIFRNSNIDKGPIIRAAGSETDSSKFRKNNGICLSEIAKKEDLGWLKRHIIHRCTEIIERLVV
jgi:hypothetical protein